MAVKARAEITLSSIRDIQSVTRYYLLQSSTAAKPTKPTTNPPGGDWVTAEPTYTTGSTNSLYFTDCTVFSDDTFVYSDVSLSSSYEAAKVAYNKAENAESIAERATHSPNLTPYGSRSFEDTHYWYNCHEHGGVVGSAGVIWNTEQLADGWIHICVDATGYTGTAKYVNDNVTVRTSPSFKPNTLYTILYEVRNNNSVLAETSANSTQFYIQESASKEFWGSAVTEVLEGSGTTSLFVLRTMAPEANTTYRKRFTKMSDSGSHAGSNPPYLFQMQHRYGAGDYVDFELRISIYEGRYLGDYMPYVISDTTDIEADISAANALAQSAKDTADGKITTFYAASTAVPTATTVGDLWIKTDDGNSLWRWNGTSWVSVDNADIQSALTAAGTAQATADAKIVTFAQSSQPTATDVGDIWIDTDNNNKLYRWDGAAWVDVHDPKIAEANEKIDNLQIGGRNLYAVINASSGYIRDDGAKVTGQAVNREQVSDFIPVAEGDELIFQAWAKTTGTGSNNGSLWMAYAFYDSEKAFLSPRMSKYDGILQPDGYTYNIYKMTAPDGAAFIRCSYRRVLDGKAKLERGNKPTDWSPAPEDLEAETGGRNLIINTLYPNVTLAVNRPKVFGQIGATAGRGTASFAEHGIRFTNTSVNWQYLYFGSSGNSSPVDMLGLKNGETYTLSADLSWKLYSSESGMANANTWYMGASLFYSTVINGSFNQLDIIDQLPITKADKGSDMTGRLIYTFTVPETAKRLYLGIRGNVTTASYYAVGDYLEARNIKLEKGNKATEWTPAPEDLENAITVSQETADGKNTVYYQTEAPSGGTYKVNDIWFDTNDGNKMYMWNGSTWVAEQFGNAAISDLSITNAKIANGTIESAKISNLDAGKITSGTMSASRIKGDELKLGGDNNTDGVMKVYNADGELVGSFTKEGLMAITGQIGGWGIFSEVLKNEWDLLYSHYRALLSPKEGLWLDQTSLDRGMDPNGVYLDKVEYGLPGITFILRREINGAVKTGGSSIRGTFYDLDNEKGGVALGPHLIVEDNGIDDPSTISVSELYLKSLEDNSYVRQPQLIMKGNNVIKNGSTNKNVVLCTIPTAYQSGYYIVPFVTRAFGGTGVPDDAGDFKYAYYNQTNYTVNLKLFNNLTSGVWYDYVYFIYALPKT